MIVGKSLIDYCRLSITVDNQDIRHYGRLREIVPFVRIIFYVSILLMIGCPFFSFYLKNLIMEFLYISEIKEFLIRTMLISLSLTVIYLLCLYYYLFFTKGISFISGGENDK